MDRIFTNNGESTTYDISNGYHYGGTIQTVEPKGAKRCRYSFNNQILAAQSAALLPYLNTVFLEKEDSVYRNGEQINDIFFPENAVISEYQILEDGRTSEVAMIGKEGVTGLEVVLNSGKASHWMRVSAAGKALKIKSEIFKREFDSNAKFREAVLNYLHQYCEQTAQKIICNCYHLIEKRLCCWLLMFADRSGKDDVAVTQEQLALFLGVQRPSITRVTQNLRSRKIIKYKRGEIRIADRKKLEDAACSCYASVNHNL